MYTYRELDPNNQSVAKKSFQSEGQRSVVFISNSKAANLAQIDEGTQAGI